MKKIFKNKVFLIAVLLILVGFSLFIGVHTITVSSLLSGDERQAFLFMKTRIPRTVSLI